MKILYVILSCDKYKDTRQKWQRETWLKDTKDFVYLDKPDGEETYKNAPLKYISFLKHYTIFDELGTEVDYDWFFFCDDDTFVYTEKLERFLNCPFDKIPFTTGQIAFMPGPCMIGFKGGEFPIYNLKIAWCSGGAGIALNREAVKNIQTHLRATPRPLVTDETDISLAIWATMGNKELTVIDNKRFSPFNPRDAMSEGLKDCISFHYCERKDFYDLYDKR